MNLVLVAIHIEASARAMPLGPAMLAAMLNRDLGESLRTTILDSTLSETASACADRILAQDPDWVGFSVYIWNRALTLELAACLKARRPELLLFAGGPEPTTNPEGLLVDGLIDFTLPGECEHSLVAVMRHLLAGGDAHGMSAALTRIPVAELDSLASPFLDQTLSLADYAGALWELSRGCPYRCDFCYESRGAAHIRRFPLTRVREELRLFHRAGVEQVFVLDPTFNFDRENAKEILRLIAREAPEIHFCFEARSEFVDAEMAALFAAIPCSLQIGLQSASDEVLRNVNRSVDLVDFERKMLLLHEAGVSYGFDLIYGLPGDSLEGFCHSIDVAMAFVPNHLDLFPLAVLPGTRLQETAPSFGLEVAATAPYLVAASPTFGRAEMAAAAGIARAADLFYNRGMAVPWFAMIIQALAMRPSEFFRCFAAYLAGREGVGDEEVAPLQQAFTAALLRERGAERLIPLVVDLIHYFGHFEALCDVGESVDFRHHPLDLIGLLEGGVTDLEELYTLLPEAGHRAEVCLDHGTPRIHIEQSE